MVFLYDAHYCVLSRVAMSAIVANAATNALASYGTGALIAGSSAMWLAQKGVELYKHYLTVEGRAREAYYASLTVQQKQALDLEIARARMVNTAGYSVNSGGSIKRPRLSSHPQVVGGVARNLGLDSKDFEKKYFDVAGQVGARPVDCAGPAGASIIFGSLNNVPRGTSATERIGRQIRVTDIHLRGTIQSLSTKESWSSGLTEGDMIPANMSWRCILFFDAQNNGTGASYSNPLFGDIIAGNDFRGHRNLEHKERYTVIRDFIVHAGSTLQATPWSSYGNWGIQGDNVTFEKHISGSWTIDFLNTISGSNNNITSGNIGMFICQQRKIEDDYPSFKFEGLYQINVTSRIRFYG